MGAASAALAATVAAPAEHPDAELFRLDREMEEAHARMELASIAQHEIHGQCVALYSLEPPKWEEPRMPDDVKEAFAATTIGDTWNNKLPAIWVAWTKEVEAQRATCEALKEAYLAKIEEIDRARLYPADEAYDARVDEMWQVGRRIFATPSGTLDGMVIKLRASDRLGFNDFPDNEAFLSIAADIRRLAKAGASPSEGSTRVDSSPAASGARSIDEKLALLPEETQERLKREMVQTIDHVQGMIDAGAGRNAIRAYIKGAGQATA
ncbi:hypothetical protein EH240_27565 [Mesorhizobium tamadayense]|uniref:Uncharacterized protein n=1 Tax=Mesorhizobium tamadayense TaxID=425306 RepID=A0A3P3F6I7_9HYPH|nr:hypothetical protein [Mesorhizobium tamadayense]RRH94243.1 hypothetical protein EH240_27565 [Mesorhizobium tamadayense]